MASDDDTVPAGAEVMSPDELVEEVATFRQMFASVMLGTCSVDGMPHVSYAPHMIDETGAIHIYVSELAQHTANLQSNPRASVMFIEDELATANIHARKRLTYQCTVEEIARSGDLFTLIMERMLREHGEVMQMLRSLEDFHLFRLCPEEGRYIRGFAQAYRLGGIGGNTVTAVRDRGHGQSRQGG